MPSPTSSDQHQQFNHEDDPGRPVVTLDQSEGAVLETSNRNGTESRLAMYGRDTEDAPAEQIEIEQKQKQGTKLSPAFGVLLAVLAGVSAILQTGMNTNLRDTFCTSGLVASAASFIFGTITITSISILSRNPWRKKSDNPEKGSSLTLRECPLYAYTGGILGAAYVTAAIFLAPELGFATFQFAATVGQLLSGIICDSIGFLHLASSTPTPWRVVCTLLVMAGTGLSAKWGSSSGGASEDETWKTLLNIFFSALAGSVFPFQACINFKLGHYVGTPYRAVAINFLVGTIIVWILVALEYVALGDQDEPLFGQQVNERDMESWMWLGGFFGAIVVTSVTIGIATLGAVSFTVIFISTQLVSAVAADSVGAFGYPVISLFTDNGRRIIGVAVAVIAAAAFKVRPPLFLAAMDSWPCKSWNMRDHLDAGVDHKEEDGDEVSFSTSDLDDTV